MAEKSKNKCKCPYCDIPETEPSPFCGGKETKLKFCSECGRTVPRVAKRCPACGAELEKVSKLKCD